jgi:hypothetical protein
VCVCVCVWIWGLIRYSLLQIVNKIIYRGFAELVAMSTALLLACNTTTILSQNSNDILKCATEELYLPLFYKKGSFLPIHLYSVALTTESCRPS